MNISYCIPLTYILVLLSFAIAAMVRLGGGGGITTYEPRGEFRGRQAISVPPRRRDVLASLTSPTCGTGDVTVGHREAMSVDASLARCLASVPSDCDVLQQLQDTVPLYALAIDQVTRRVSCGHVRRRDPTVYEQPYMLAFAPPARFVFDTLDLANATFRLVRVGDPDAFVVQGRLVAQTETSVTFVVSWVTLHTWRFTLYTSTEALWASTLGSSGPLLVAGGADRPPAVRWVLDRPMVECPDLSVVLIATLLLALLPLTVARHRGSRTAARVWTGVALTLTILIVYATGLRIAVGAGSCFAVDESSAAPDSLSADPPVSVTNATNASAYPLTMTTTGALPLPTASTVLCDAGEVTAIKEQRNAARHSVSEWRDSLHRVNESCTRWTVHGGAGAPTTKSLLQPRLLPDPDKEAEVAPGFLQASWHHAVQDLLRARDDSTVHFFDVFLVVLPFILCASAPAVAPFVATTKHRHGSAPNDEGTSLDQEVEDGMVDMSEGDDEQEMNVTT